MIIYPCLTSALAESSRAAGLRVLRSPVLIMVLTRGKA
jgi:hypothetical protein